MKQICLQIGTKGNENVIPAKAGNQKVKELDSRLRTAGMTAKKGILR